MQTATRRRCQAAVILAALAVSAAPVSAQTGFVNFEYPHVDPITLTEDHLYVVNSADNRLEVFERNGSAPLWIASVPVGLDPVSVRLFDSRLWVVNMGSDSVSVIDAQSLVVVHTLQTLDSPAAIRPGRQRNEAYVTCSGANALLIFDRGDLDAPADVIALEGEEPRLLRFFGGPGDERLLVGFFHGGNKTTILGGGSTIPGGFPPNVVNHPSGPYGGTNPPPNDGNQFRPPVRQTLPPPPRVGLIVKENDGGDWLDDNGGDWTDLVSGVSANLSGRPLGWELLDHDLAIIDLAMRDVSYVGGAMNINMAAETQESLDRITIVGTDAINQVRFEPILNGRFLRVNMAYLDLTTLSITNVVDLNPHLSYTNALPFVPIPQVDRNRSIGDPRGIAWNLGDTKGYVTGMGSNNVIVIDAAGGHIGEIEVGEGPTGITRGGTHMFVLNRFAASVSVIDTATDTEVARVPFYDPSPPAIKTGRKHLYDTHKTSGLGHVSCASCHVDVRMDRLAWDLGDPGGEMRPFNQNCPDGGCQDWHPMKGPMTTQTLQDIIGLEPHHWRGDRNGIEEFNGAFVSLLGDDQGLTPAEMQEFEDFLATIHYPPNLFRDFDNSLPTNLPLPGHFTTGIDSPPGQPLPDGNAEAGLLAYRTAFLDGVQCVTCHTLPTGAGANGVFVGPMFQELPPGPLGEAHLALVSVDGSTNVSMKTPQLRNLLDKVGFELTQPSCVSGFGYLHDGSVDSIARFLSEPVFNINTDQQLADMVAFMLSFAGSDLPQGSEFDPFEPPGVPSRDAHAAVGRQVTLRDPADTPPADVQLAEDMIALAETGAVGLVAKASVGGAPRGWMYQAGGTFVSDESGVSATVDQMLALNATGAWPTLTIVPEGTQRRIGIDRDVDGFLDFDEVQGCSNPADPASQPPLCASCTTNDDCSDGDPCNGEEVCDAGACVPDVIITDCDGNGVDDSCDPDCNENGVADACDIASGTSADVNGNGIPDGCEVRCGGEAGEPCPEGFVCELPLEQCDAVGFCVDNSGGCPADVWPVCGCNGATYSNPCTATADNQGTRYLGPCEMCEPRPLIVPADGGLPRSRYLSFDPGYVQALDTRSAFGDALAVEAIDVEGVKVFEGVRYIGEPVEMPEGAGAEPTFWAATLQCEPFFPDREWGRDGEAIHVYGAEIIPDAAYEIRRVTQCDQPDVGELSTPVRIETGIWGDVVDPIGPDVVFAQPDLLDILAIVDKFLGLPGAPIKANPQMQPQVPDPSEKVQLADVLACVDSFLGVAYPYPVPDACSPSP